MSHGGGARECWLSVFNGQVYKQQVDGLESLEMPCPIVLLHWKWQGEKALFPYLPQGGVITNHIFQPNWWDRNDTLTSFQVHRLLSFWRFNDSNLVWWHSVCFLYSVFYLLSLQCLNVAWCWICLKISFSISKSLLIINSSAKAGFWFYDIWSL